MRRKAEQFKRAYTSLQRTEKELGEYSSWVGERFFWVDMLAKSDKPSCEVKRA
jgi:hypothetical protein